MKKIWFIIFTLLLSACSSPTPRFYQPVPIKGEIVYPKVKGIILLHQVVLPAEATRPQITTIGENDYELKIDEFNRWGASPNKIFQRIINQNLNYYLPNASIENQTSIKKDFKYSVAIEITDLIGKLGHNATLNASYFIRNPEGKVVKFGKIRETVAITGGYEEYILTQSHLLAALSAQIAADLSSL